MVPLVCLSADISILCPQTSTDESQIHVTMVVNRLSLNNLLRIQKVDLHNTLTITIQREKLKLAKTKLAKNTVSNRKFVGGGFLTLSACHDSVQDITCILRTTSNDILFASTTSSCSDVSPNMMSSVPNNHVTCTILPENFVMCTMAQIPWKLQHLINVIRDGKFLSSLSKYCTNLSQKIK